MFMNNPKGQIINEMIESFQEDYRIMNEQIGANTEALDDWTISVEEFRQAGIAAINKLYGKC